MVGHGKDLGGKRQNIRASGDFALVVDQHRGRCHPTDARRYIPSLFQSNVIHWFVAAFSSGPTSLAQVRPGIALLVALRIEHLRTRIFRGIELQDHPLGIRNAGVRCRV